MISLKVKYIFWHIFLKIVIRVKYLLAYIFVTILQGDFRHANDRQLINIEAMENSLYILVLQAYSIQIKRFIRKLVLKFL